MIIQINNLDDTQKFAASLAQAANPGDVYALSGELGSGKTTLAQAFLKTLGVTTKVLSPTFVLMRQYPTAIPETQAYHLDLYRVKTPEEVYQLGLPEIIDTRQEIVLIEWPEVVAEILPSHTHWIELAIIGSNERLIKYNQQ